MSTCHRCGAALARDAAECPSCGTKVVFARVPHPHIESRKKRAPTRRRDMLPHENALQRFNSALAVKITATVGTMWCAYAFAGLALFSLPEAVRGGTGTLIAWIAQTFLQLVLLSIIIVGQKVDGAAADKRAGDTYDDAEALLHEAQQIQDHLTAQDKLLTELSGELRRLQAAPS